MRGGVVMLARFRWGIVCVGDIIERYVWYEVAKDAPSTN
jgi:hypothetical protein